MPEQTFSLLGGIDEEEENVPQEQTFSLLDGVDVPAAPEVAAPTLPTGPIEDPGLIERGVEQTRASTSFLANAISDMAVQTVYGIPGLAAAGAAKELTAPSERFEEGRQVLNFYRQMEGLPPLEVRQQVVEDVTGRAMDLHLAQDVGQSATYLLGVADASYQDMLDSQAEAALATSDLTGLPLAMTTAGTTGAFAAINFLSPGKYVKAALGVSAAAAGGLYGIKLIRGAKALRRATELLEFADSIGDTLDPLRSYRTAEQVAEKMQARAIARLEDGTPFASLSREEFLASAPRASRDVEVTLERLSSNLPQESAGVSSGPIAREVTRPKKGPPGISFERGEFRGQLDPSLDNVVFRDDGGNVGGVLAISLDSSGNPEILQVAVREDLRRQGVATGMFKKAKTKYPDIEKASGAGGFTEEGARFAHSRAVGEGIPEAPEVRFSPAVVDLEVAARRASGFDTLRIAQKQEATKSYLATLDETAQRAAAATDDKARKVILSEGTQEAIRKLDADFSIAKAGLASRKGSGALQESLTRAHREMGLTLKDAQKAGRLEKTIVPTDQPELFPAGMERDVLDLSPEQLAAKRDARMAKVKELGRPPSEALGETGLSVGRQYVYRRDFAEWTAAERSKAIKQALSTDTAGLPRSQRRSAEALDQQLREDLTFYSQGTGNAKVSKVDTLQDVMDRILAHPKGEEALALAENLRPLLDGLFVEMAELNARVGAKEFDYLENWIRQAWLPKQKGGVAGVGSIRGILKTGLLRNRRASGEFVRVRGGFEETRRIPNYRAGILSGREPVTLDIAEIVQMTERQYGETMALKKLLADISEVGVLPDGTPAFARKNPRTLKLGVPKGMEDDFVRVEKIPYVNRLVDGEGDLFIHKDLWRPLRNILEGVQEKGKQPGSLVGAMDDLAMMSKRSNFALTMFHAFSLSENAILSLGPVRGVKTLGHIVAAEAGGIPLPPSIVEKMGGPRALDHLTRTGSMRESAVRALRYGVTLEAPRTDLMRSTTDRAFKTAAEELSKKGLVGKGAGKALSGFAWAQRTFDAALWDRLHQPLKTVVFDELFEGLKRAKRTGRGAGVFGKIKQGELAGLSDDEIGYRVAEFVNDEFGGQKWELLQGKIMREIARPKNLAVLRRHFLSPDWNASSFKANLAMTSILGKDPVRGVLGARHWRNALIGLATAGHAMNYALTAANGGKGHFAWDNDPGKDGMIAGILPTHIDTGQKDENGRRIYARVNKQLQEVPEFVGNGVGRPQLDFLGRKMVGWNRLIVEALSGMANPHGRVAKALQQARTEGVELDGFTETMSWFLDLVESVAPFGSSFNPLSEAPPLGRGSDLFLPLPQSRGGSRGDIQRRLTQAMIDESYEEIERLRASAEANGYDAATWRTMYRTAITNARKKGGS